MPTSSENASTGRRESSRALPTGGGALSSAGLQAARRHASYRHLLTACIRADAAIWHSVRLMSDPRPATPGWRPVGMCWDGEEFDLEGLNPWEHEWEHSHPERIVVAHPEYPAQRHDVDV